MSASKSLADWLVTIENSHPQTIDLGLERIEQVAYRLRIAPGRAKVITVAGTNGKGSCVATCDHLLRASNASVGCYTSPHLRRYNERVRINGIDATDAQLVEAFEAVERARAEISLTYFEHGTLAALWLFQRQDLDYWVLEVGLGGRLDAVNIVDPDVAIVTSVDIDHIDWLGSDREGIAREKAGIFRPQRPAVCADRRLPAQIKNLAHTLSSPLFAIEKEFDVELVDGRYHWRLRDSRGQDLVFQTGAGLKLLPENIAAALQALALVEALPPLDSLATLLLECATQGRMQRREIAGVEYVLDVAHNPAGIKRLAEELQHMDPRPTVAVFAAMADKDAGAMISSLRDLTATYYLPSLTTPRAIAPEVLGDMLASIDGAAITCDGVADAISLAADTVGAGGRVVVCGSFFTVGPALDYLDSISGREGEYR